MSFAHDGTRKGPIIHDVQWEGNTPGVQSRGVCHRTHGERRHYEGGHHGGGELTISHTDGGEIGGLGGGDKRH